MTKSTTRGFFFAGTFFFVALFILLTIHTHTTIAARTHEEGLTEPVRNGEHVWGKYNCENCHTLLGEGAYYAPDLTQIVSQRGPAYLTQFLADPSKFYPETRDGRLMPTLGLTPDEIADVIAFLDWVGHIDTNGWPPRPILVSGVSSRGLPGVAGVATSEDASSRGKALFNGAGACVTCHSVESGVVLVGPSLAAIGKHADERIHDAQYKGAAKSAEDYLEESIVKPGAFIVAGGNYGAGPGRSLMPDTYGTTLKPEQVKDLVAYLRTLQ
jgi:nitric oxide reductase subunit C